MLAKIGADTAENEPSTEVWKKLPPVQPKVLDPQGRGCADRPRGHRVGHEFRTEGGDYEVGQGHCWGRGGSVKIKFKISSKD